jgi:UDPglucose 6-dehydrogenase
MEGCEMQTSDGYGLRNMPLNQERFNGSHNKVCVIGCGYVGLVTGTCLAELGNHVICADVDREKVDSLSRGVSIIHEPGLQPLIKSNLIQQRLNFTADIDDAIKKSDIIFIAVGTPTTPLGTSDLSQVDSAIERILLLQSSDAIEQMDRIDTVNMQGKCAHEDCIARDNIKISCEQAGCIDSARLHADCGNGVHGNGSQVKVIVMKSTVPVGSGERFSCLFGEDKLSGKQGVAKNYGCGYTSLRYVSNPEFLREGQAVDDFMKPDRIVIGGNDKNAIQRVAELYPAFNAPVIITSTTNAELIKYASNAFLATKISFVNEIANLCEEVGADVGVVTEGMGLDPRINPHFLRAGIGYGGSCFPKDVKALKQLAGHNGYHFELLSAVIEVNEMQKTRPIQKLRRYLQSINGRRIGVFGLTFKPHTDDIRESVGIDVVRLLQFEGAEVVAFDPIGLEQAQKVLDGVELTDDPYRAAENVMAIVIATDDPFYSSLDWERIKKIMAYPLIIDGRNIIDAANLPEGFILERVGKPAKTHGARRIANELALVHTADGTAHNVFHPDAGHLDFEEKAS